MKSPSHIRGPRIAPAGAKDPIMPRLSHYEILEQIAEGGMGVVYKARDLNLGRLVALKLLSPSIEASQADIERLFEEARAISRLNHPNVATIFEVDQKADEPFMALEYLPGGTLRGQDSGIPQRRRELADRRCAALRRADEPRAGACAPAWDRAPGREIRKRLAR